MTSTGDCVRVKSLGGGVIRRRLVRRKFRIVHAFFTAAFSPASNRKRLHSCVALLASVVMTAGIASSSVSPASGAARVTTTTERSAPQTSVPARFALPKNCAAKPSKCGFPDATNTGVRLGKKLRPSGCVTAKRDGQVIQNLVIDGCTIGVEAKNVVIRNVKMTLTNIDMWAIIVREGASATIKNVEIAGRDLGEGSVQYAILSQTMSRVKVKRANLHHCADCIQGERMKVVKSYIHDLANPPDAHVDGFQCNSSCEVVLRGNTIFNQWGQTAAIALFPDFGTPRNSIIEGNLLAGGGYTLYAGEDEATGIQVIGNRFARHIFRRGGYYGPATNYARGGQGNVWNGNVWDDTGKKVRAP